MGSDLYVTHFFDILIFTELASQSRVKRADAVVKGASKMVLFERTTWPAAKTRDFPTIRIVIGARSIVPRRSYGGVCRTPIVARNVETGGAPSGGVWKALRIQMPQWQSFNEMHRRRRRRNSLGRGSRGGGRRH